MAGWIIVKQGEDIVKSVEDSRLIEIVNFSTDINTYNATQFTAVYRQIREKYKGKLWPDGDYHILTGISSEDELTSSLLTYMQE